MENNSNPWLGLNTYSENDKLYGRDTEIAEVSDIICNNSPTVIYGRSGIGKSSLLKAGVFPHLRYNDFMPVYIRLEHNTDESYIAQIRRKITEEAEKTSTMVTFGNERQTGDLSGLLNNLELQDRATKFQKCVVIVFDQFEEIYTLVDPAHKPQVHDFFTQLASLLNDNSKQNFRVIICLREDYLYLLEQNSAKIPSLKRNRYRLRALNHEQGHDVICLPREKLVTDEIAELILNKVDPGKTGKIAPAILSLFMHELYEKGEGNITAENITLLGDNIIPDFYENGIASISQETINILEDRLVTIDGYRHNMSYNDAIANGATAEELGYLKDHRIITIEKGEGNQLVIELSHDMLCPIVLKHRTERKHCEETERLQAQNRATRKQLFILSILSFTFVIVIILVIKQFNISSQRNEILSIQSRFVSKEAMELIQRDNYIKAMALVAEVYPKNINNPERPLVHEAYDVLRVLNDYCASLTKILHGHTGNINSAQFNPNGKYIVTASSDNTARIWDAHTGKCLSSYNHSNRVFYAEFSPDGKYIVTAAGKIARIWRIIDPQELIDTVMSKLNGYQLSDEDKHLYYLE